MINDVSKTELAQLLRESREALTQYADFLEESGDYENAEDGRKVTAEFCDLLRRLIDA